MNLLADMLEVFLPRECHICGCHLRDSEEFFCVRCLESLPRTRYHLYDLNPMEKRFAGILPFVRATGHFFYSRNSHLSNAIHDMKYRRFPNIGRKLGEVVGEELLASGFFDGADMVAGVPMHWWKRTKRGYNQADFIAKGVSLATGLPICTCLSANRAHKTQTAMTLDQRQANLKGTFSVNRPELLQGKGLVIVDDVCTTGSTLRILGEEIMGQVPDCRLFLLSLCVTY